LLRLLPEQRIAPSQAPADAHVCNCCSSKLRQVLLGIDPRKKI